MIAVLQLSDRATDSQRFDAMFGGNADHAAKCAELLRLDLYDCVAFVRGADMDVAYRLTNSVEHGWYEAELPNLEVAAPAKAGCRSTSVGDVLVEHGRAHVVSSFGFTDITATAGWFAPVQALCRVLKQVDVRRLARWHAPAKQQPT